MRARGDGGEKGRDRAVFGAGEGTGEAAMLEGLGEHTERGTPQHERLLSLNAIYCPPPPLRTSRRQSCPAALIAGAAVTGLPVDIINNSVIQNVPTARNSRTTNSSEQEPYGHTGLTTPPSRSRCSAARPAGSLGQQLHLLHPPSGAEQDAGQRAQLLAQHGARLVALRGEKRRVRPSRTRGSQTLSIRARARREWKERARWVPN